MRVLTSFQLVGEYGIKNLPTFMFFDVGNLKSNYEPIIGVNGDNIINRLKYFEGLYIGDEDF